MNGLSKMSTDIITDNYVFFYGGIYSQWFLCEFEIYNQKYNCAEQFMMAQKAIMFKDKETCDKIMQTNNPYTQKKLGKTVKNFDKTIWELRCKDIVITGNLGKFGQNTRLREQMLETGSRRFVEASPTDKIWGIGIGLPEILKEIMQPVPHVIGPNEWQGTNWLGECLDYVKMQFRLD